ncbi:MAG: hypothetical protein GVY10_03060 [Verrucomicrobia bacterium]|nr:hypothetical protein [Verrucomicrobiota bacterium]
MQTELVVDFPAIAVVNYFSEVTVTLDAAAVTGAFFDTYNDTGDGVFESAGGSTSINASFAAGEFTGDANLTVSSVSGLGSYDLVLQNVWAVRSTGAGTLAASVDGGSVTLTGENGGTIDVTGATASQGTFPATGFAAANAVIGGVTLTLDLSDATGSGNYSNGGTPAYEVTVELN